MPADNVVRSVLKWDHLFRSVGLRLLELKQPCGNVRILISWHGDMFTVQCTVPHLMSRQGSVGGIRSSIYSMESLALSPI